MTMILALPCKGGVVIASDGVALERADGEPTTVPVQKIFPLGKNKLWGGAGDGGDIKEFRKKLDKLSEEEKNIPLSDEERLGFLNAYANCDRERANALGGSCTEFLVVEHKECPIAWWRASNSVEGEFFTEKDPLFDKRNYLAAGQGRLVAETILRNINYLLTLEQGVLMAYRIIKEAIKMGNFFLGEPIDIWTIKNGQVRHIETAKEMDRIKGCYAEWLAGERFALDAASLSLNTLDNLFF